MFILPKQNYLRIKINYRYLRAFEKWINKLASRTDDTSQPQPGETRLHNFENLFAQMKVVPTFAQQIQKLEILIMVIKFKKNYTE